MEHAIHEWHSCGQMEPSSANYSPVQLIPMVTHMKGKALWSSSCPSLSPSFYMEMFSIFYELSVKYFFLLFSSFYNGTYTDFSK